jgi:hypothetical protein
MSPRVKAVQTTPTVDTLSSHEIALIEATRKIPADAGERYRRTMSIIEYINALAEGMRSANA